MMQQTSLQAFEEIQDKRNKQHKLILAFLKVVGEANNTRIAASTGLPINVVTPRVNELRKMQFVIYVATKPCPITHKQTMWWKAR